MPLSRRAFLANSAAVTAAALAAAPSKRSQIAPVGPNVLFFFTDDQRFDTVHALGNPYIITPNLDALAGRGIAFTNACIMGGSCPAVCMPSRAMLMTGRNLFGIEQEGQDIPVAHTTLPEVFRRSGYVTFGTGKWHNGRDAFARGFSAGDRVFWGGMSDQFSIPLSPFDPRGDYPAETRRTQPHHHTSDLFSGAVIDFLRQHDAATPFFAYISFTAPHDPRDTHPEFHALYDPASLPLPGDFMPEHPFDNGELRIRDEQLAPWPRTPEVIRKHLADYYAMITHVDARIGDVMNVVRERGFEDNTIVVFAGDNGLALGSHGLMGKQNLYGHSVRVPLLLFGPGIPRGEQRDCLCYLHDVFPTLCDLAGLDVPSSVESRSLAANIRDPEAEGRDRLFHAYKDAQRAVRDRRYKLIEYVVGGARTSQLFDLENDPLELKNLAIDPSQAETVARLRGELARWRDELGDTRRGLGELFWQGLGETAPARSGG